MWQHNYTPGRGQRRLVRVAGGTAVVRCCCFLLAIRRKPAWIAALSSLGAAIVVAALVLRDAGAEKFFAATTFGMAFGLLADGLDHLQRAPALPAHGRDGAIRGDQEFTRDADGATCGCRRC